MLILVCSNSEIYVTEFFGYGKTTERVYLNRDQWDQSNEVRTLHNFKEFSAMNLMKFGSAAQQP